MKKLIDRRDFVEIILNKRREERENSDYLIRYFLIQYFYNSRIKKLEQRLKILNVQIEEATEKIKWQNFVNEYDNTTGLIKDKYACHSCDE